MLTNRIYVANGDVFLKGLMLSFAHFSGLIVALIRIVRGKALRSQKEVYVVLRIFLSPMYIQCISVITLSVFVLLQVPY